MNVHHLCFAHWRAYGVQRCFYTHETATPNPGCAPVYRQKPPIADAVLAWLAHFYRRSIVSWRARVRRAVHHHDGAASVQTSFIGAALKPVAVSVLHAHIWSRAGLQWKVGDLAA